MSMTLESAVSALGAVEARRTDARLEQRLAEVQDLLADELVSVERRLAEIVTQGAEPATDAAAHLVTLGGKRIRPLALLAAAACFGEVPEVARELAVVSELVHSATLLHDDVVDEGNVRRGAPTARRTWGNGISVLAGDLLLVHALDRTQRFAPEIMPDLTATLRRLVDGEVVQLRGRTQLDVSEATYERILRDKTASLFAFCARTGGRLGGASIEQQDSLATFGELLGIAFQLVDDVLDYAGETTGKTLFADLGEGKLTLPLVIAARLRPELEALLRRIHAGDPEPVEQVSRIVLSSGACDEVRRRARHATDRAVHSLREIPASPARGLLELVAFQLADRVS
jgi:octaprenyl-diphosphate synthase